MAAKLAITLHSFGMQKRPQMEYWVRGQISPGSSAWFAMRTVPPHPLGVASRTYVGSGSPLSSTRVGDSDCVRTCALPVEARFAEGISGLQWVAVVLSVFMSGYVHVYVCAHACVILCGVVCVWCVCVYLCLCVHMLSD